MTMPAFSNVNRPVWRNWSADSYGLTWTSGANHHFTPWGMLPPDARQIWDVDPRSAIVICLPELMGISRLESLLPPSNSLDLIA